MKIKITSKIQEEKNFNYILHTLHVTEANILDYIKLCSLFEYYDFKDGIWETWIKNSNDGGVSFVNLQKDSFDIEIVEYEDNLLDLLKTFLTKHNLQYES